MLNSLSLSNSSTLSNIEYVVTKETLTVSKNEDEQRFLSDEDSSIMQAASHVDNTAPGISADATHMLDDTEETASARFVHTKIFENNRNSEWNFFSSFYFF